MFLQVCLSTGEGGGIPACIGGGIPACLAAGLQWGGPCRFPGPHPRGKLRGIWPGGVSRPTPKGEVEGDQAGGSPGPHPRGKLRGIWLGGLQAHTLGVPAPGGCGDPPWRLLRYASYWNTFLLKMCWFFYNVVSHSMRTWKVAAKLMKNRSKRMLSNDIFSFDLLSKTSWWPPPLLWGCVIKHQHWWWCQMTDDEARFTPHFIPLNCKLFFCTMVTVSVDLSH